MKPGGLPILTYHALDSSRSTIATDPGRFAETIVRLVEAGFVGVDLVSWIARGRPALARAFAVTFDDGLRSILRGIDVLERYQIPATVFLVTGHVGRANDWPGQPAGIPLSPMLDWSEVADLSRRGFGFGAHTTTHPRLDRVGPGTIERELVESRQAIETYTGRPCRLMAYPYGASDSPVREQARSRFDAAFGTRLATAGSLDDPLRLPRIDAYYLRDRRVLDRLLRGQLGPWLAVRRGLRTVRSFAMAGP